MLAARPKSWLNNADSEGADSEGADSEGADSEGADTPPLHAH